MTKRIFRSVVLTAIFSMLLAAVLIALTMFAEYERDMTEELRSEAGYIAYALQRESDDAAYFDGFSSANRVTLIAPDGMVLYDSGTQAAALDNHVQRPEVQSALVQGWGESKRYSDTLAETTYYYALRTSVGNVLRVANTRSSVLGVFLHAMPLLALIVLCVVLVSLVIARFMARRIVAPMNALNLDTPLENKGYDELLPLLTRMDKQRREILQQMQQLEDARRELIAITENMREGLILADPCGKVLSINGSAAQIFGVYARNCIGRDLVSVCENDAARDAMQAVFSGDSREAFLEMDGRHYQLLVNPVSNAGMAAGMVLLILDVTERYSAEISRRQFTANVSHELKTPLTSISGYAEIICNGVARPEDISGFAARIHSEASRLMRLINDILELSRLDEHRGIGDREEVSLLSIASEASAQLEKLAQEKCIRVAVSGDDARIMAYPVLLREMVFNLVDNAVKYTEAGGRVDVQVAWGKDECLLSVRDTGIGIPCIHQEHIFERFYRVDKSHSRSTGGTGLGLSIVKHGAEIHKASVSIESEEGKGTCISLRFPC